MYKFSVPYYKILKNKKGISKNVMLGMNWYFSENRFAIDRVKKEYHEIVTKELQAYEGDKIEKYKIKYKFFYKVKNQDMMNVVAVLDKFIQDGLQEFGIIKDDNVQYCKRVVCEVAEQDKENPRLEVELEEIE